MRRLNQQAFVFFTKGDDIATLNKVILYVRENEITQKLKIVTVLQKRAVTLTRYLSAILKHWTGHILTSRSNTSRVPGEFGPE